MKTIIHLCCSRAKSDSVIFADNGFNMIYIDEKIGVENYNPVADIKNYGKIHGVIANPVCTQFSVVRSGFDNFGDHEKGLFLVRHCQRIIEQCNPDFWYIENPATGRLKLFLGEPDFVYEPWEFGSPWTKKTALWGKFNKPDKLYTRWEDVPKLKGLYTRPGRKKPSLAFMHYNHVRFIPEFQRFDVRNDSDFRSLCSQGFAKSFYEVNK